TNSVGKHFKNRYTIYSNDLLYFSYVLAKAIIENNRKLEFNGLKKIGIDNPLDYLESSTPYSECEYYKNNYTPKGDSMYFTVENGQRIDFIRNKIEEWKDHNVVSEAEYYYLLASLIASIPFISNTTGTYGAYLKSWDKRALKP